MSVVFPFLISLFNSLAHFLYFLPMPGSHPTPAPPFQKGGTPRMRNNGVPECHCLPGGRTWSIRIPKRYSRESKRGSIVEWQTE